MKDRKTRVLLVGESWVSAATHHKGFDSFGSVTFHLGAEPLVAALRDSPFELTYMPSHEAQAGFPQTMEALRHWDVLLLSDVGANTLLLHPDTWLHGRPTPNRLMLIHEWTRAGGGLAMIGGYLSFQGFEGKGGWRRTIVADALPVEMIEGDDRLEIPEGFTPEIYEGHPVMDGLPFDWPLLLGANEVRARPGADVLARVEISKGGQPLLVTGSYGAGRTAAWMSDIGPHWVPQPFVDWPGYKTLWSNLLDWLAKDR